MKMLTIFFTLVVSITAIAQTSPTPKCSRSSSNSEVCEIAIKEPSQNLPYFYEIKRAKSHHFPTVIAIPGGPGQGLIGLMNMIQEGSFIPEEYGVILIDPRGNGKNNYGADLNGSLYSTTKVASDIIKVINAEKLTNYFIHGQSYGTAVATILGRIISKLDMPFPRGIILSGVVHQFFEDPLKGYNEQLQRLFSAYSPEDQQNILESLKKIEREFGEKKRIFAHLFINLLTMNIEDTSSNGVTSVNMKLFFDDLANKNLSSSNQATTFFYETAKEVGQINIQSSSLRKNQMPESVKCRELTMNDEMIDLFFNFEKYQLESKISDCKLKGYFLDRPYKSNKHQISKIPLFYIQGALDPATPLHDAYEHFKQQKNQNKVFVQLNNYSHTGLIGLWPCKENLWNAFIDGPSFFKKHILNCSHNSIQIKE